MPEVFNRRESPTQTSQDAQVQEQSREIWGRPRRGGHTPSVKAYRGSLSAADRGIEFDTSVAPHKGSGSPFDAIWYFPETAGTEERNKDGEQYAAIRIENFTNKQL